MSQNWHLYGVDRQDEKTWLASYDNERSICSLADFIANNPHFEYLEIREGNEFRYVVMSLTGVKNDKYESSGGVDEGVSEAPVAPRGGTDGGETGRRWPGSSS